MTWLKIDDLITEHPKFVGLSPQAWTLWLHGLAYASRNLTDGTIPAGMLPRLSSLAPGAAKKAAGELVAAGLWDDLGDHWGVHDYLDHQRSKAQVDLDREAAAERQRKAREKRAARKAVSRRDEPDDPAPVTDVSQRDNGVSHGGVTLLEAETETELVTTSSNGFNNAATNPLEKADHDTSELRAQRIARHTGIPSPPLLTAIRTTLADHPDWTDDVVGDIALQLAARQA